MSFEDLHILVAEDDDFQRKMLVRMLGQLGIKDVIQAGDGKAALDLFQDLGQPIDIIISDLDMPGMDGMEFIRHVSESGAPASMILTSALAPSLIASVETMTKAYGINLLGAIEKPATVAKLSRLIKLHKPPQPRGEEPQRAAAFSVDEIARGLRAGQFEPYHQPKIEIATGRIAGAEALARWRHPQKGIVPPVAFIAGIEEHGLMDELTWAMLGRAAADCRNWRSGGLDASVSVNLSLSSLTDTSIADHVTDIVHKADLDPRHVVLEVTETAVMTDVARALENLARLRMKGFGLSIDDYGTGYSSMQQLSRVPFTELKIDQSFLIDAAQQERLQVMISASLDMARKLGLKSVAEGVETRREWDLLARLGCDYAQGYFISRPLSLRAFRDWVLEWTPPE